jgi:23S rRNA (pseudouridine1915-N3)-methyltransferase
MVEDRFMLSINILCVGKIKENYLKDAIAEYSKRLSKYCNLKLIEVPDEKVPEKISENVIKSIKDEEAKKMLNSLKKETYLICLDLNGKEYSSEEFSEKIENIAVNGNSSITFVIGGTLGIGDEILSLAKEKICFSKMTFPHQLIRVFLLEQIFRSFKISNGETYHR